MKITEDRLKILGFKYTDLGNDSPYEIWEKDGIVIWNFNNRHWLVDALDQAGIDVEFKTIGQLSDFFKACNLPFLTKQIIRRRVEE